MSYFAGKNTIVDSLGNEVEVGLFGGLKVSSPTAQVSLTFDKPFDTSRDVINTTTGTGSLTSQHNRSLLRVKSGGVGTAECTSKRSLRYKTGTTVESYFTANFIGSPDIGDTMYIGIFDDEDGLFLGYNESDFVVGYRNINKDGGTEPDVTQVVDMSAYDLTKIHRFRIRFGYLGVGNISFEIMDGTQWNLIHKFQTDAALSDRTHIGTVSVPMSAKIVSTSGADLEILSGSWSSQTYSKEDKLQDKPFSHSGFRTVTPNAAERILVGFRSKTTFGSYTNKIRSKLLYAEFASGSEGLYKFSIWPVPAGTIASGTFSNVDANSVMEVNTTITVDDASILAALASPVFSTHVAVASSGTGVATQALDFEQLGLYANPGDEFVITFSEIIGGAGTDEQAWSLVYADLF